MLTLVALVTVLILAVGLIGILFSTVLSQHSRSQYDVDSLSLSLAKAINSGDRVAQMNQLVARSRELVYTTRQNTIECDQQGLAHLAPLCDQLMNEAYSSQAIVEYERNNQIQIISKEIISAAQKYNLSRSTKNNSFMPWLQTFEPEILRVDLGRIDNVQSNVKSLTAIPELADYDRRSGFVDEKSNLYKANMNARLPSPDDDLTFKFSSLPALVENTCAPPRVANFEVFKSYGTAIADSRNVMTKIDQIPQAVTVYTKMDVAFDPEALDRHSISVSSTGVTGGAVSSPE